MVLVFTVFVLLLISFFPPNLIVLHLNHLFIYLFFSYLTDSARSQPLFTTRTSQSQEPVTLHKLPFAPWERSIQNSTHSLNGQLKET